MLKIPSMLLKLVSRVGDLFQLVSNIDLGERGEQGIMKNGGPRGFAKGCLKTHKAWFPLHNKRHDHDTEAK